MRYTAKQFAKKLNTDYLSATHLLKMAVKTGQAREVAKLKSLTGKGKPSTVYEVMDVLTFNINTGSSVDSLEIQDELDEEIEPYSYFKSGEEDEAL